ncbi:phosphatidate cytidylyltransferase, mitochondrial isoform X2 [Phoenix dactylifera]|uniref:Phosphatidate cytidylyltransferase, mitochondrial n=1 Tax=Phoenix dactylifera TaxID=42345 RepID=A0A8B7BY72_PHODC|nr:phosphatidate cytidylyltransferase, mitochondrial isoform X2 [Phoenix dactylifera]
MEERKTAELAGPLELFPPVDFCCVYGSALLPNNNDKTSMVDYILGVADPIQWHSENLERNRHHYSKWMVRLGPRAIIRVADGIGAGVHFNPFVEWRYKKIKYGVVQMHNLAMDVLTWDRFYLSGRLQKPVHVLIDNWDVQKVNLINLKMAISASLLLLPPEFTEEDLYAKICSLSYMGDMRMLFAEDKNKVKKIVEGSFNLFQSMYKPLIQEHVSDGLLSTSPHGKQAAFKQDFGLSATNSLFSSLPWIVQIRISGKHESESGIMTPQIAVSSREVAAKCVRKALRSLVMVSSARQAVSGVLAAGGVNAARYLGKKISKAWKSRTC